MQGCTNRRKRGNGAPITGVEVAEGYGRGVAFRAAQRLRGGQLWQTFQNLPRAATSPPGFLDSVVTPLPQFHAGDRPGPRTGRELKVKHLVERQAHFVGVRRQWVLSQQIREGHALRWLGASEREVRDGLAKILIEGTGFSSWIGGSALRSR